jgi:hypothetical protein
MRRSFYIDGHPFKRGPNIVLMYLALIPGSGAATGYTGKAPLAPLLCIVSCLAPVVPLPEFIQDLLDTQMT